MIPPTRVRIPLGPFSSSRAPPFLEAYVGSPPGISNASLPEMNPLLDLGDDSVEDDFQRMLSDWESHIDTLQVEV